MAALWTRVTDIPVKLFIDRILPFCEVRDMLSLGCTSKFFALVVDDYNFTGTARKSGWRFIYRNLRNPRVFTWGCMTFSFSNVTRVFIRPLT